MSRLLPGLALLLTAATATAQAPRLAGCEVFPPSNVWNVRVDELPLDPRSADYVAAIGRDAPVHPDFGSGDYPPGSGAPIGIPWVAVPESQPRVPVSFLYAGESDPGPYPIPPGAPIEGGAAGDGDRHVLVVDRGACRLYELFNAFPRGDGGWRADSGAVFDLRSHALRPETWTSADAAGLPILPGLVRFEEVAAGEIRHALRFTAPRTRRAYVWPARHFASSVTDPRVPPMGQRFRLRADFDLSGFSPRVRVILTALQRYGMMLADNGSAWFLSGVPDERWDNDELRQLRRLRGADFEAVDVSSLTVDPDSGETDAGDDDDDGGGGDDDGGGGDDDDDGGDDDDEPFACVVDADTLCLHGGRFRVRVTWGDFAGGRGAARVAPAASNDSGLLWFFAEDNWEMLIKVLDGCAINDRFWVLAAAATDVEYEIEVADSATGHRRTYVNPLGRTSPAIVDTAAFATCP